MTKSKILAEIQQMMTGLAVSNRRDIYIFLFNLINDSGDDFIKKYIGLCEQLKLIRRYDENA